MSSVQITLPRRRLSLRFVAVLAIIFSLGALTGFAMTRVADGASRSAAPGGPGLALTYAPVALGQTMSDAAYLALHPGTVSTAADVGQTMSDAAYVALHPDATAVPATGSVGQTMSDAAYLAMHPSLAP
jgi:hypothetical protein